MMCSYEFPTLLVIAHDNTCSICDNNHCDCKPDRSVLVGDLPLPRGPMVAPVWYGPRVAKLEQFFKKV